MIKILGRTYLKYARPLKTAIYSGLAKRMVGSFQAPLTANGKTWLTKKVKLGRNTHFNGLVVNGHGAVTIGDNFHSGVDVMIFTDIHDYDHGECVPYGPGYIIKDVVIEDNVWLGARVLILGGVTIGEGAIIQAGAVVVSDVPKYGIAGGSPAKVFKYRDIEHYERLKSEGKFW